MEEDKNKPYFVERMTEKDILESRKRSALWITLSFIIALVVGFVVLYWGTILTLWPGAAIATFFGGF